MVLGGLEIILAGFLYHKYEKGKEERRRNEEDRQRLAEEDDALEREIRKLEDERRRRSRSGKDKTGRGSRRDYSAPPAHRVSPGGTANYGYVPAMSQMGSPTPFGSAPSMGIAHPNASGLGNGYNNGGLPMSPPPAYPGSFTGLPAHWDPSRSPPPPPGPGFQAPPMQPQVSMPVPMPMPMPIPIPQARNMPPTPPMEYGWKPGVSYPDAPAEIANERQEKEARRAARRAARAEQRRTANEGAMVRMQGQSSSPNLSGRMQGGGGLAKSGPGQTPKPFQRVRFTGLSEGMDTRSPRGDSVAPRARGHRWESGGGDAGGGA